MQSLVCSKYVTLKFYCGKNEMPENNRRMPSFQMNCHLKSSCVYIYHTVCRCLVSQHATDTVSRVCYTVRVLQLYTIIEPELFHFEGIACLLFLFRNLIRKMIDAQQYLIFSNTLVVCSDFTCQLHRLLTL